jgi:hypothetical protein
VGGIAAATRAGMRGPAGDTPLRADTARTSAAPEPRFLREERSPARATALIVGGVVVGVGVLVAVLLSLGGGSSSPSTGTSATHTVGSHGHGGAAVSPARTRVVVLNATEVNGLAHRLSGSLRQNGYALAAPLDGRPAGRATSVVEYASGARAQAQHVAQTLGIGQVRALEAAVAPLVGAAAVVVIAGADQAAGGSGAAGGSEPSTSATPAGSGEPSASTAAPAGPGGESAADAAPAGGGEPAAAPGGEG